MRQECWSFSGLFRDRFSSTIGICIDEYMYTYMEWCLFTVPAILHLRSFDLSSLSRYFSFAITWIWECSRRWCKLDTTLVISDGRFKFSAGVKLKCKVKLHVLSARWSRILQLNLFYPFTLGTKRPSWLWL